MVGWDGQMHPQTFFQKDIVLTLKPFFAINIIYLTAEVLLVIFYFFVAILYASNLKHELLNAYCMMGWDNVTTLTFYGF